MIIANEHADRGKPMQQADADALGMDGAAAAQRYLAERPNSAATPLHALPSLAADLGIGALYVKDEGFRLGLGSFKALGGAYAVACIVVEEAAKRLARPVGFNELQSPAVRAVAQTMTFACATDGNHGRSVAQGAQLVGAKSVIFVHAGVSDERIAAIARFGAEMVRVDGNYDDSVAQATETATAEGWTIVSDTAWPGYERIPGLVMQGYTTIVREALAQMPAAPTHVFVQAGVGGFAAAVAGHLSILLGKDSPKIVVVEPARAACLYESARAGRLIKVDHGEPTVMAMLECCEPSLVGWRILTRLADAFMIVAEDDAVVVMNRLARPVGDDPAVVAGESGGAGLAGLFALERDAAARARLGLDASSRVLVVNTEGATDPALYASLVGMTPAEILAGKGRQAA